MGYNVGKNRTICIQFVTTTACILLTSYRKRWLFVTHYMLIFLPEFYYFDPAKKPPTTSLSLMCISLYIFAHSRNTLNNWVARLHEYDEETIFFQVSVNGTCIASAIPIVTIKFELNIQIIFAKYFDIYTHCNFLQIMENIWNVSYDFKKCYQIFCNWQRIKLKHNTFSKQMISIFLS